MGQPLGVIPWGDTAPGFEIGKRNYSGFSCMKQQAMSSQHLSWISLILSGEVQKCLGSWSCQNCKTGRKHLNFFEIHFENSNLLTFTSLHELSSKIFFFAQKSERNCPVPKFHARNWFRLKTWRRDLHVAKPPARKFDMSEGAPESHSTWNTRRRS